MSEIDKDLVEAIGLLDPEDKSHFTEGGEPSCNALSELLGRKVSKDERNAAFAAFKQAVEAPETADDDDMFDIPASGQEGTDPEPATVPETAPEPEVKPEPKAKKATPKAKEPEVEPRSETRAFTFTGSYLKDGSTSCRGYKFAEGEETHVPLTDESAIRLFDNHPQFEG